MTEQNKLEYRHTFHPADLQAWETEVANVGYAALVRLSKGRQVQGEDASSTYAAATTLLRIAGHPVDSN